MKIDIDKMRLVASAPESTFTIGAKCYLDTFSGMVPCVVTAVARESFGFLVGNRDSVSVRLTADRGAYNHGEIINASASNVIPRNMRFVRSGQYRIDTVYRFIP